MKRFFSLILVFLLIFSVVGCHKKKKDEKPAYEEQVTQEVSAEEGGTVKNSDGSVSIEIPADALDSNTTITMTIYDSKGYTGTEGKDVVSKVVEFEPSGTVFKKPVIIRMTATEAFEDKILTAAVLRDAEGEWSYSEHGAYAVLMGKDEAGDPIMQSAAGDPIMLNAAGDPIMQQAAGDPIMMSAAGDPIMLASAGDPIMTNAAGDPIMNAAAGDPIMMTTGHFTSYAFFVLEPDGSAVEEPDTELPVKEDDYEPAETDDDEPAGEDDDDPVDDEDIVPEPEKVYSKAICTGLRTCSNGTNSEIHQSLTRSEETDQNLNPLECPKEGDDFYGQDVQYAVRKSCVPQEFERISKDADDDTVYQQTKDNNTGLTWLYTGKSGTFTESSAFCSELDYAGKAWRLPTPKELMTIVDSDTEQFPAFRQLYFSEFFASGSDSNVSNFWTSIEKLYFYQDGSIMAVDSGSEGGDDSDSEGGDDSGSEGAANGVICVSGEEYGKIGNYTSETVDGEEAIRDSSTNLLWQKTSVSDKTWKEALKYCENLTYAGYSDWRLPNKNELTTLLDYSKTDVLSSFPGMTANVFASSTRYAGSGGEGLSVWSVSMKEGRIDYVLSDNEIGEQEVVEEGDETDGPQEPLFSVRCVRSDLDELPADGIPLCNEKIGYAPCRDASTDIVWSPKMQLSGRMEEGNGNSWSGIAGACRSMTFDGKRLWRAPTISELRTLIKNDKIKTGGTCRVTDSCFDFETCFDESECVDDNEAAFESGLRDYGTLVSGTAADNSDHTYDAAWAIHTPYGALSEFMSGEQMNVVARCVFDETLPELEFPYTQNLEGNTYLVWSSMSESELAWYDAAKYCMDLEEGGSDNWRVPTLAELEKIEAFDEECIEEGCAPDAKGKYSVLGDVVTLWSSEDSGEEEYPFYLVNFMFGRTDIYGTDAWAYVRCVRAKGEPETATSFTFPYADEENGLLWSEVSESEVYDFESAESYCNGLNEAEYGGRATWRVPDISELETLIRSCESSPTGEMTGAGRMCINYSFEGYSVYGDMFRLISSTVEEGDYSTKYYEFDFASGEKLLPYWPDGYVRCVTSLGV